ncbi:MAG TPA: hypothetical protein VGD80_10440 [Kofleriaceae bacterium]
MTQNTKLNAALVIAAAALAVSIYTAVRGPADAASATHVCVDRGARDQADSLRKMLVERDALVTRLARTAGAPPSVPTAESAKADPPSDGASPRPSQSARPQPKRYTHFEVPNPAVTVTQKADATYDIRTTDPRLSGTIMTITAVTQSGEEDTLYIRIP